MTALLALLITYRARALRIGKPRVRVTVEGAGVDVWWGWTEERRFGA